MSITCGILYSLTRTQIFVMGDIQLLSPKMSYLNQQCSSNRFRHFQINGNTKDSECCLNRDANEVEEYLHNVKNIL